MEFSKEVESGEPLEETFHGNDEEKRCWLGQWEGIPRGGRKSKAWGEGATRQHLCTSKKKMKI